MPAISHLNPTWEHTLTDILNHDHKTQMGIIMRAWVKDNNMTDFTSMLTYTADKFTPTGFLRYYKEKVVRRRCSNPGGHTDGLVMFACSSDASDGQSS